MLNNLLIKEYNQIQTMDEIPCVRQGMNIKQKEINPFFGDCLFLGRRYDVPLDHHDVDHRVLSSEDVLLPG